MTEQITGTGTFIWNELGTRDLKVGVAFCTQLFGWGCTETPIPGEGPGVYALFQLDGVDIAGAYALEGPMFEGVPPRWACYVAVDDVHATLAKAEAAGGKTLWPAMDIPGIGRMGGFADPTGAALAVFKMGEKEERPDLDATHGFFCWNELATNDTAKAAEFYGAVVGRVADHKTDDSPMPYTEWKVGDESVGGMLQLDPSWGPIPQLERLGQGRVAVRHAGVHRPVRLSACRTGTTMERISPCVSRGAKRKPRTRPGGLHCAKDSGSPFLRGARGGPCRRTG
jgi:predicted enzyme related to lactoylglutathione lyase